MKYMLLIHADESAFQDLSPDDNAALVAGYTSVASEMERRKVLLASDRLKPTVTATTVRVRDGELLVTDGPFAETKEQLGGYYLIDVPDLDHAIEWARRLPGSVHGCVEIRPIWERPDSLDELG